MATMVMTAEPFSALPTSNGHTKGEAKALGGGKFHIDISGLEEEAYEDACNQSTPCKARPAAAAELPTIFSAFKNPFAGPCIFGSSNLNTPVTQNGNHDAAGVEQITEKHQEDQNGATDSSYDTACNGLSEEDSQEKLDLLPVPEPQELAGAFPPTFGQATSHAATTEDSHNPPTSHPSNNISARSKAKSPSRPSSPYDGQGQDVHINCVQLSPVPGTQADAVVSTTNTQSASLPSAKGEYPEHQEQQHAILNANPHQKSQFLLTISAPSQSGHYEASQLSDCRASGIAAAGGAQLEYLLARVKHDKTVSQARAWEEGAKAKVYNRYTREELKITAWENTMKAKAEARVRKAQENLDKQKAKHIEKMMNAVASAHCKAQKRRAAMEARRAEDIVKAEEMAAHIRATGKMPRECLCFPA